MGWVVIELLALAMAVHMLVLFRRARGLFPSRHGYESGLVFFVLFVVYRLNELAGEVALAVYGYAFSEQIQTILGLATTGALYAFILTSLPSLPSAVLAAHHRRRAAEMRDISDFRRGREAASAVEISAQ